VDGISFTVHPRTVDGTPSTRGSRPARLAAPSKSPPPGFLVGDVFQRSPITFIASTRWMPATHAARSTAAALAAGRVCWWARIRRPGGGGALQEWRRGPQRGRRHGSRQR